ncbi:MULTISPECIES: hypothetical protein [unclassified Xanthomonas]|uniref:hypothetical protein n=1 Tax=unclassified Xanthomonas TaxID=2643310 RepID=UPI00160BC8D3|nr:MULTISPECIES: hypothetical protein [unclassified Xanthomonas]MBB4131875.1 hypothetical protein [Xanthomonas sp. 3075]MBB5865331.1 hypothetical protein [Xanthomonas sp. 3058]
MVSAQFLQDNGFSNKASTAQDVYIKDVTSKLKDAKGLHAHLKVTFTNAQRTDFEIHGTLRSAADAEALGQRKGDDSTVGRALWIYADGTFRTSVDAAFWSDEAEVTLSQLKRCARELKVQVSDWEVELEREGAMSHPSAADNKRSIDALYATGA